ncbi:MAG: hypothetical protein U0V73_12275 [Acidimicrobiia bacterium]
MGSTATLPDLTVCRRAHVTDAGPVCDAVLSRHFVGGFRRADDPQSTLSVVTLAGVSRDFADGQRGTSATIRGQDATVIEDPSGRQRTVVWREPGGLEVVMVATRGDRSPPLPTHDDLAKIATTMQQGLRPLRAGLPIEVASGDTAGSWLSGRGNWFAAVREHSGDACVQFGTRTARGLVFGVHPALENACVRRRIGQVEATARAVSDAPGPAQVRVMGTAPATASRVRVELDRGRVIEGEAAPTDRGFAAFAFDVPYGWTPRRVVALDDAGRGVGSASVGIPKEVARVLDSAAAPFAEVARGSQDGTRWTLGVRAGSDGSIAMRYREPLTRADATVPAPSSSAPVTTTFLRSFLVGATVPDAIRVQVEGPSLTTIDTPATSAALAGGLRAAVWITPVPEPAVERTLTITATDAADRTLGRATVVQAATAPSTSPVPSTVPSTSTVPASAP